MAAKKKAKKKAAGSPKKSGAKAKSKALKPKAKPAAATPLKAALQSLAKKAGADLATTKNNDRLDTKGASTALPQLTETFVRTKVFELAGSGKATDGERAEMVPLFKQAFADKWAQLVKQPRV